MGTEKMTKSGIKRKREAPSEMGMIMADILQTELNVADDVILAHSEKASPVIKKIKVTKANIVDDGVKLSSVKTTKKTNNKTTKKLEKVKKQKTSKKTKQVNLEDSETVDTIDACENDPSSTGARLGLADVMTKILNKKVKSTDVILAKCETDKQRLLKTVKAESTEKAQNVSSKDKEDALELTDSSTERLRILKKKQWEMLGRVKLTVLDKDRERNLQRMATKGVVQLFNAVHKQQALLDIKVKDAGATDSKRERAVQSLTKGNFLDMLKSAKNDKATDLKLEPMTNNETTTNLGEPTWSVLRDDFMGGATMKDWDKQNDDDSD